MPYTAPGTTRLPPKLKRIEYPPGAVPPPYPGRMAPPSQPYQAAPSPAGSPATVSAPIFVPSAPEVYRAPAPALAVMQPSLPSVRYAPVEQYPELQQAPALAPPAPLRELLQQQPALSMDYNPSPASSQSQSLPMSSLPASPAPLPAPSAGGGFVIGAGDTVQIDVLGRPELSAKGNVASDGRVTVALVGAINIGGLTPVQAAERIAQAYREGQYLVSPQVTVTLEDYQSQLLTVLGEVRTPGRFPLRTRLSVLDGLALAGGISEQGASTAYLLRPENGVVTRYAIDLEALIQAGAGQQYFETQAGDTLVVPRTEVFYIYGEARNPNAYKLKPGMTVIQALSLAGGLTDKGSDKRIDIRRRDESGRLRTLAASLNEPLQADDVVYVRERLF